MDDHHDITEPSLTIRRLETDPRIDRLSERLLRLAHKVAAGGRGDQLRGQALGHALHPALTDLPVGLWTSAGVLDLVGGRRARPAARRLIALGLAATPLTAATGLAEYTTISSTGSRRVATVHAAGNSVAAGLYTLSWLARLRGRFLRGKLLALAGATALAGSAYLGGHLAFGPTAFGPTAFGRTVGAGERNQDSAPVPAEHPAHEAHADGQPVAADQPHR